MHNIIITNSSSNNQVWIICQLLFSRHYQTVIQIRLTSNQVPNRCTPFLRWWHPCSPSSYCNKLLYSVKCRLRCQLLSRRMAAMVFILPHSFRPFRRRKWVQQNQKNKTSPPMIYNSKTIEQKMKLNLIMVITKCQRNLYLYHLTLP